MIVVSKQLSVVSGQLLVVRALALVLAQRGLVPFYLAVFDCVS